MTDDDDDVSLPMDALATIPVFPLPRIVLLPGLDLPLHIFEPRYRAMTRDALDSHRALAVSLQETRPPGGTIGDPPMCRVAGAGRIVEHHQRPDGRYDIVVRGLHRVRLEELPREGRLYRRASAELMSDGPSSVSNRVAMTALIALAAQIAARIRLQKPDFELPLEGVDSPARLADTLAAMLVLDSERRQDVLETLDVSERLRIVHDEAVELLARLVRDPDTHGTQH